MFSGHSLFVYALLINGMGYVPPISLKMPRSVFEECKKIRYTIHTAMPVIENSHYTKTKEEIFI